jgi:hypothetical protein
LKDIKVLDVLDPNTPKQMKKQNFMKLFSQRNSSQSLQFPSVKLELMFKCIGGPCKLLTTKQIFIGTKGVINKSLLDGN